MEAAREAPAFVSALRTTRSFVRLILSPEVSIGMTKLPSIQVPPPSRFEDFEELCLDLWKCLWNDDHAQMHGRRGQSQNGVDVYGCRDGDANAWEGVQCKVKSQLQDKKLTRREIENEVKAALKFESPLRNLVIATTAPRDTQAQEVARKITTAHQREGRFAVRIAAWEDIYADLCAYPQVLQTHYPFLRLVDECGDALRSYLEAVRNRWRVLALLGVREGRRGAEPDLPAVYTDLQVKRSLGARSFQTSHPRGILGGDEASDAMLGGEAREVLISGIGSSPSSRSDWRGLLERMIAESANRKNLGSLDREEAYQRSMTAVEAVSVHPRLVLLGGPGSGKSTFARFLALSMAGEWLSDSSANLRRLNGLIESESIADPTLLPWPHGLLLPIYVELRRFVSSSCFPDAQDGGAENLLSYLEKRDIVPIPEGLKSGLRQRLKEPRRGVLLLLDGFDEVPGDNKVRERLRQVIRRFTDDYPYVRILVTSRPYAYQSDPRCSLDDCGFAVEELAPFESPQIEKFVGYWYRCLGAKGETDATSASKRSTALVELIQDRPHLKPLGRNPMMLTMMTDLHASGGGRLEGGRAALYESSVGLLLNRWNESRDLHEERKLSNELGMDAADLRHALERLAYEVHREKGSPDCEDAADITVGELYQSLVDERPEGVETVDQERVIEFLHQRSGIVLAESKKLYRFPHRSYQEFLAACHLLEQRFPQLLAEHVQERPELWREVALLAVGQAKQPYMQWALLERIMVEGPPDGVARADPRFSVILIAALAVDEWNLGHRIQPENQIKFDRVRDWLQAMVKTGALDPVERAKGGDLLGRMGDPRVAVPDAAEPQGRSQQIDWVSFPKGAFTMGRDEGDEDFGDPVESPANEVMLDSFQLARFPVTVSQFAPFVGGGYEQEQWWVAGGFGSVSKPEDWDSQKKYPNRPVVGVSWYEAAAYCAWLGAALPTEAQWERAAGGTERRRFPWGGEELHPDRGGFFEGGIGHATTVGMYPTGDSPDGVSDLGGNVLEWCRDRFESYKSPAGGPDGFRDVPDSGSGFRVLRGGCWLSVARYARSAYRSSVHPSYCLDFVGFRPARSSPLNNITPSPQND